MSKSLRNKNSNPELLHYQCENCGTEETVIGSIPRCLGCGKVLCEICQNYFLCPQDYHKLENRDQKMIKKLSKSLENAKQGQKMFTTMPPILGGIGIILLLLLFFFNGFVFYFIFGFFGSSFILIAVMIYFIFRNIEDREEKRVKNKVKDILIPYKISPVQSREISPKISTFPSEKSDFCPSCGEKILDLDIKVCEMCGAPLL